MKDILSILESLHRPRLLMQAARIGLQEYNRQRFLPRLLKSAAPPGPGAAIAALMQIEARLEARRATGDAGYSIARHVEVLIALMGEARLLRARLDTRRRGRHPA